MSGAKGVPQVQRVGARGNRYDHKPQQIEDGRWLVTRQGAAYLADRDPGHIRTITDAQRRRWAAGEWEPDEDPIEVLCTLNPVTRKRALVLLDVDAITAVLAGRPFIEGRRRSKLDVTRGTPEAAHTL